MYIHPNSVVKVLHGVPLDTTYDHSIYFETATAQQAYFSGLTKYTFDRVSYQRVNKGRMRMQVIADNIYDCNYLMFQNTAYGNKWFYAFITAVEYVNDNVSEISYELDVLQTWFFDYTLDACFVEREHAASDNLFENLVPENLGLGNGFVCNYNRNFDMNDMHVCVLISKFKDDANYNGTTYNNVFSALRVMKGYSVSNPTAVTTVLNNYVEDGQEDRVVAIYQYPAWIDEPENPNGASTTSMKIPPQLTSIDGYAPKNKKLFASPYNFIIVSNNMGQTGEYHWEDWNSADVRGDFEFAGVAVTQPAVLCYPLKYRGVETDWDSGLAISNFPQCGWVGDAFKAWYAQNGASATVSTVSNVIGGLTTSVIGAVSGSVGSTVGGIVNSFESVFNAMARREDLENTPPQVHGQAQTGSLNAGMFRVAFTFYCMSIKAQQAKVIDDFFERYGYATHRNKVPNRNVRPHWCYTKTQGCTITGSIPADDARAICDIYNAGITWWKKGEEVGNYSLNNAV